MRDFSELSVVAAMRLVVGRLDRNQYGFLSFVSTPNSKANHGKLMA
jgi:hypothetical protein